MPLMKKTQRNTQPAADAPSTNVNTGINPASGAAPQRMYDGYTAAPSQQQPPMHHPLYDEHGSAPVQAQQGYPQNYQQSYPNDVRRGQSANPDAAIPPTSTLNRSSQGHPSHGRAFAGKLEHALGSLVGSDQLKAEGRQKEQEANAFKVQGSELAEAERLEREALVRRERAVAHGAHPDNKHLGAGFSAGRGSDVPPGNY